MSKTLDNPQKIRFNEYKGDWKTLVSLRANVKAENEARAQKIADLEIQRTAIIHQYGSQLASSLKEVHVAKPGEVPRSTSGYKY